ncbi:MAG TPA: amidase family protein, partial [Alkalispirochaeta sp.]|nr:amidase family protein [Alkalispirochaeta sp.]
RLSGTFPLSPRLDTVGWFVSCAEDARLMLELTSQEAAVPDSEPLPNAAARQPAEGGIRLAAVIPPDVTLDSEAHHRWNEALNSFHRAEGVSLEVVEAPPVLGSEAWNAYGVIGSVDAAAVHGDWLDRYQSLYDPLVWSLIDRGRRWSPARLSTAEAVREDVTQAMHELLSTRDMLVMPVTPTASPTFERADGSFREAVLRLNVPVSLAGLGALTVPLLHSATRSSGMQLVIPPGGEQRLCELITRLGW